MSERLNKCPNCGVLQYTDFIVKEHNPDTTDLNMNATLRCGGPAPEGVDPSFATEGCGHEWEGLVMSHAHAREREQGWSI